MNIILLTVYINRKLFENESVTFFLVSSDWSLLRILLLIHRLVNNKLNSFLAYLQYK